MWENGARGRSGGSEVLGASLALLLAAAAGAATTVPNEVRLPGTQQAEVPTFASPDNCDNCHGGYDAAVEPAFLWRGGMMANATRDPLFWATVAIAEQDFLPGSDPATRGGVGDLCIRCHSVQGWIGNRSTPTNGSGLASGDLNGVECEFCHLMVDPDQPVSIPGTSEVQNDPFHAYDDSTLEPHRGGAQYVLNGNGTRLGPYATNPPHAVLQSPFHRKADLCGTCHDVSNPAVGDLAPGNGAQIPLAPGSFSGVLGSAVAGKAAQNNPPYRFGVVERTFSEWLSSAWPTTRVNDFPSLPAELRVAGGAPKVAYDKAFAARSNADYEDGTPRWFTCQTCHMSPATGKGCNKNGFPVRTDMPTHDQTGAGYWMPDLIQAMSAKGTLRLGGTLTQVQKDALDAGKLRATALLQSSARVSASQAGPDLVVKVTNLTAHKLPSGYPEGRRFFLNVRWYDAGNNPVAEDGAYGPIGRTAPDLTGTPRPVSSLLDPAGSVVFEAEMGIDQPWAAKLLSLGYPGSLVLARDRMTDATTLTLGELAASPPARMEPTFHFALNNVVVKDERIPPYGFRYDDAKIRNALPVPEDQFGAPGVGGTYRHWDERAFPVPPSAVSAQIRLYYQQTSWEYVEFLWRENDGLDPFLGNEGRNLLDGWLATGMSEPLQITMTSISGLVPPSSTPPGEASHGDIRAEAMEVRKSGGDLEIRYTPACGATGHIVYFGDPAAGFTTWTSAICLADTSGTIVVTPPAGDAFLVVVGENGTSEGSYGRSSAGIERPEAGILGGCGFPQVLAGRCDAIRGARVPP